MTDASNRTANTRPKTLEYRQAMKDFHIMFPSLERDIIECVLRSNSGHVDSTIDQLLQLTQDMAQNRSGQSLETVYYTYDGSSTSSDSIPSELRDHPTSSDDDQPPKYTPNVEPPPSAFNFPSRPVESYSRRYKDWNPPLLGTLPDDFLRIMPVRRGHAPQKVSPNRGIHNHHHHHRHLSYGQSSRTSSRTSPSLHKPGSQKSQSPTFPRKLQRRKTTGEVNVVLGPTMSGHRSPQQRMVKVDAPSSRSTRSPQPQLSRRLSAPSSRTRRRTSEEQDQYMEDRKVALLLQNEEFLRELKRNEQFLHELNRGDEPSRSTRSSMRSHREQFRPISVDPLQELPKEGRTESKSVKDEPAEPPMEDKAFKESLKHMSKSAKRTMNILARKFYAKRNSYKVLDPAFANTEPDT